MICEETRNLYDVVLASPAVVVEMTTMISAVPVAVAPFLPAALAVAVLLAVALLQTHVLLLGITRRTAHGMPKHAWRGFGKTFLFAS